MRRLLTEKDLANDVLLSLSDKQLIEQLVYLWGDDDGLSRQALRAFLVEIMEENVIDDDLRNSLEGDAAAFIDGWRAARGMGALALRLMQLPLLTDSMPGKWPDFRPHKYRPG